MNNEPETQPSNDLPIYSERTTGDIALGFFLFGGLFLLLSSWIWLKSIPLWSSPQRFGVLFHDVAGMNTNAAVYTDGVRIGSVEQITLKGKHKVLVQIKVGERNIRLPEGTSFTILNNGLVGAKYVDVTLPDEHAGKVKILDMDSVVKGTDPVRTELLLTKLARSVSAVDFEKLQMRLHDGFGKIASASDNVSILSRKLQPAADRAAVVETRISELAVQMGGTTHRINRLLDDPQFSQDLKVTVGNAKVISDRLKTVIEKADEMVGDPALRHDVVTALQNARETTDHLRVVIDDLKDISENKPLRADLKEILADTKCTMEKVKSIVCEPCFGSDMKSTLSKARTALKHITTVSKQVQQILAKRSPLLQLLFGKPGKLEPSQTASSRDNERE